MKTALDEMGAWEELNTDLLREARDWLRSARDNLKTSQRSHWYPEVSRLERNCERAADAITAFLKQRGERP